MLSGTGPSADSAYPSASGCAARFETCCTITSPASRFIERGFVSPPFLKTLIQEHMDGRRDNRQPLWALLMLELWFRQWQDAPVNADAAALAT